MLQWLAVCAADDKVGVTVPGSRRIERRDLVLSAVKFQTSLTGFLYLVQVSCSHLDPRRSQFDPKAISLPVR